MGHSPHFSENRLSENGLQLNIPRTEYLQCGSQTRTTIQINGQTLKKATQFKYLGSLVSMDGDTMPDIWSRINSAWLKWRQTTGILCDSKMPEKLKAKIYTTVVRPVALYGAECWPATKKHKQALNTIEMKMLRWTLGLTLLDHVPNDDIRQRLGIQAISKKMQEARLWWYGHVMRREPTSVLQRELHLETAGQRPCGRPKKRWMDTINEDKRATNLSPADAPNRDLWK
ncbi:uncharacterized protein LOC125433337 [Sphaerodactylus townsendi]|uniref:uncharacterized protein LOC125433337 n=1 Tax=Sphaerodactylus townsendi TaxID=933632 RepID=UPI002026DCD1|nr:uncharacterized protein LOC125433337 [Sphaerodactylus townsendi]